MNRTSEYLMHVLLTGLPEKERENKSPEEILAWLRDISTLNKGDNLKNLREGLKAEMDILTNVTGYLDLYESTYNTKDVL